MIREESEAKFKYCPLLKTSEDRLKFCLVADCMMWRRTEEGKGFCGLAGKPAQAAG
ncbi:MAG: hypothetical protein ACOCWT_03505 [Desulfohalobiaceae bacterium]